MKEALEQFGKLMERNYDFPKTNIVNGFGDMKCNKCGGLAISVSLNPQYSDWALKQHPMPKTFMGYPVNIDYSEPSIAL